MSPEESRLAPAFLFRSFLLVAGAYVANLVLLFLITYAAFPDSVALMGADQEQYQKIMENEPERVFPSAMFWVWLVASMVTCPALGYLVARLAPVGKYPHSVFFAAILFVAYLQLAIGAESEMRSKLMLLMVVSSVAALIGSNGYLRNMPERAISEDPSD